MVRDLVLKVCMYVCIYVHMYARIYACIYARIYACIYACIYASIHVSVRSQPEDLITSSKHPVDYVTTRKGCSTTPIARKGAIELAR